MLAMQDCCPLLTGNMDLRRAAEQEGITVNGTIWSLSHKSNPWTRNKLEAKKIAYQPEFRPVLPTVFGQKDYREFRETLIEIDNLLTRTGIEHRIISEKAAELGESAEIKGVYLPFVSYPLSAYWHTISGSWEPWQQNNGKRLPKKLNS